MTRERLGEALLPAQLLTDAQVRSLKADGASRLMIDDAKAQGLCLRVSASSKSWSFIYRPKGSAKQRRYTIGDYPSWSLAQAREKTFALRRTVQEGGDPVAAAQERVATLTVAGFRERYIERYAKNKLRSWRDYEGLLERDVIPALGQRRAEELTRAEVANLLDKIAARGPVVGNRVLNTLSAAYSWGVSEGLVPLNPVTGLKRRAELTAWEKLIDDRCAFIPDYAPDVRTRARTTILEHLLDTLPSVSMRDVRARLDWMQHVLDLGWSRDIHEVRIALSSIAWKAKWKVRRCSILLSWRRALRSLSRSVRSRSHGLARIPTKPQPFWPWLQWASGCCR